MNKGITMEIDQAVDARDRIRISKGTKYQTKNPKRKETQVAKKSYTVVTGTISPAKSELVWWIGSGKYFCCAAKEDIELIK